MKIHEYGNWTKIYNYDGYGGQGEVHSIHRGHLEEQQVSEICRSYATYEHLKDGIVSHLGRKNLWKNLKIVYDGYGWK